MYIRVGTNQHVIRREVQPLAFRELKAQAIQHELVVVCENLFRTGFLWSETLELVYTI